MEQPAPRREELPIKQELRPEPIPPRQTEMFAGTMLRQDPQVAYHTRRDAVSLEIEKTTEEVFAPPVKPAEPPASEQSTQNVPLREKKELRYIGEAFSTYIITESGDELVLIDKHAAHERILYEKLLAGYGKRDGQLLLEPVSVNLSAAEKNALLAEQPLLEGAGFEVEDFGGLSVLVRSVPAELPAENTALLIEEIAARLAVGSKDTLNEKTDWLLHSIACRAAIKAGDKDPAESLLALARQILDGVVPPFCPHGRPVLIRLSQKELEKQFGRRE